MTDFEHIMQNVFGAAGTSFLGNIRRQDDHTRIGDQAMKLAKQARESAEKWRALAALDRAAP